MYNVCKNMYIKILENMLKLAVVNPRWLHCG